MKSLRVLCAVLITALLLTNGITAFAASEKGYEKGEASVTTWPSALGGTNVMVYFEVENTGDKDLYCSLGTVELEDSDGNLIKTSDMVSVYPRVIQPGEKAYYTDSFYLDEKAEGEISAYTRAKPVEAKVPCTRYDVTDVTIKDDMFGLKVLGRVRNNTDEDEDGLINVVVLLYDEKGTFLGSLFTYLTDELEAGDRLAFEITSFGLPSDLKAENVASFVAFAYPNQFQF